MPLEKIKFEYNEPVAVTLRHPAGKIVSGRFGEQVYFSLADNRCMYLELDTAQKINMLEPQAGETVVICKRSSKIWDVWLSPDTEKMRAVKDAGSIEATLRASVTAVNENRYATLRVPVLVGASNGRTAGASVASTPAPAQATTTLSNGHSNNGHPTKLEDEANMLVDVFAAVLERALDLYKGRVKPEEIRSLLLSAYISRQKGGAHA